MPDLNMLGLPVSPQASRDPNALWWQLSIPHIGGQKVNTACSSAFAAALRPRNPHPHTASLTWKVALYGTCMLELPARVMTGGLLAQLAGRATPLQVAGAVLGGAVVVWAAVVVLAATAVHNGDAEHSHWSSMQTGWTNWQLATAVALSSQPACCLCT